jgi:UPF0755 protein
VSGGAVAETAPRRVARSGRPRRGCLGGALLGFLLGALVTVGLIWAALRLPDLAAARLGPPAPNLSLTQRVTLPLALLAAEASLTAPLDPSAAPRPFTVSAGETPTRVAARLEAEGFIRQADTLRRYLVYAGLDTTLQAGEYRLSAAMSAQEIAHALQDATPSTIDFHILPGWRVEEIAAALPTSGLPLTPAEFLAAATNPPPDLPLPEGLPAGVGLEGFLFPDAYELGRDADRDALLTLALTRFSAEVANSGLRQGFAAQGWSLYEGVTLASLVEREAVLPVEMPLIASVFANRLAAGMRLDSDPTVQYAVGGADDGRGWWPNPLTARDLQVDSPYNTYLNLGLPPGPIANPSAAALTAMAYPATTPYYYFRAACDGSGLHTFSETYPEHLQNACP